MRVVPKPSEHSVNRTNYITIQHISILLSLLLLSACIIYMLISLLTTVKSWQSFQLWLQALWKDKKKKKCHTQTFIFFCMGHYVYILSEENINWMIHVNIFLFIFPYYFFLCAIYMLIFLLPTVKSGQSFHMWLQSLWKHEKTKTKKQTQLSVTPKPLYIYIFFFCMVHFVQIWSKKYINSHEPIYVCLSLLLLSVFNLHVYFFVAKSTIRTYFSNGITVTLQR